MASKHPTGNLSLTLEAGKDGKDTVFIGDEISITVTRVRGTQIQIAIQAPKHVSIDRQSVREKKNKIQENK